MWMKFFKTLIFYIIFFFSTNAFCVNFTVEKLSIYRDSTYLTISTVVPPGEHALYIPEKINEEDIIYNVSPSFCKVDFFKVQEKDLITDKVKEIRQEIDNIQGHIRAIESTLNLLKTIDLSKKEIKDITSIVEYTLSKRINLINKKIQLQQKLKQLKDELQQLQQGRPQKQTEFLLNARCRESQIKVTISYPVHNIKKFVWHKIIGDSNKGKVRIQTYLSLKQSSPINWNKILVEYFTYSKSKKIKPPRFQPWYIPYIVKQKRIYLKEKERGIKEMLYSSPKEADKESIEYIETVSRAKYIAKNINIPFGKDVAILLFDKIIDAKLLIEIDGWASGTAFLSMEIEPKFQMFPARADIFIDGMKIGKLPWFELRKQKKERIYFGEDLNFLVKKTYLKDYTKEHFFGNKKTVEKIWMYEIQNNHSQIVQAILIDRIPVSRHSDYKVKVKYSLSPTKVEENGKVIWNIKLKPKENKVIKINVKIKMPKEYK